MNRLPVHHPALDYLAVALQARYHRARSQDNSRGASAVEWVVISAILVSIALAVGILITNALKTKAGQVKDQIGTSGNG